MLNLKMASEHEETTENEEDSFYFESDHLALRGNPDYSNMLRYISSLLAQKAKVEKHIEELMNLKNVYKNDIDLFLEKIKKKEELVPSINTPKIKMPILSNNYKHLLKREETTENSTNQMETENKKSKRPGQLWTCEEQRRLEELLIKYPEEPVEMRRFTKIANELGNRTPIQVATRLQKYFLKLQEAGMPIPGRAPKNRRALKYKPFQRSSTFFPGHQVPVLMPEDDFDFDLSNDDEKNRPNNKAQVLEMLKIIRKNKEKEETESKQQGFENTDDTCKFCQSALVFNNYWNCLTCNQNITDTCSNCMISQLLANNFEHLTHKVIFEDRDKPKETN